ncbi:MAG: glutaredoxin 3 [Candidatus Puniceispirillaceae bacterium]
MAKIEIYTAAFCPFCVRAKRLLDDEMLDYEEIDVSLSRELRQKMTSRAEGRTSVPQIFIDDIPIGGCDDLMKLHHLGKLDRLVGRNQAS